MSDELSNREIEAYIREFADEGLAHVIGLRGAHLYGIDLYGVDLRKVDLREADLRLARLQKANLQDANLGMSTLTGADLTEANLQGVHMAGARLNEASLQDARLIGASFLDADTTETRISIPLGMSSRHDDVVSVHGFDRWFLGCHDGDTVETVSRILAYKYPKPALAYLYRMASFAVLDEAKPLQIIEDAINQVKVEAEAHQE